MVDGPDAFRRMLLKRSAEHEINPINTARNVGAVLREWLPKPCEKQGVGRGEQRCIADRAESCCRITLRFIDAYVFAPT